MILLTPDMVAERLRELGPDESHVVTQLRMLEVKGWREDDCRCPVANFLHRKWPQYSFSVGALHISWDTDEWDADWYHPEMRQFRPELATPDPVADFIRSFDTDRDYDDLDLVYRQVSLGRQWVLL